MKYFLALLIMSAIAGTGCKKIKKLTNFYYKDSIHINIDPKENTSIYNLWLYAYSDSIEDLYQSYGSNLEKTNKITLSDISVRPDTLKTSAYLSNLIKSIEVYVVASDLEKKKIAWYTSDSNQVEPIIYLEVTNDDLKEYLISDDVTYNTIISLKDEIGENIDLIISYSYYINTSLN